jgi:hypothetical protein
MRTIRLNSRRFFSPGDLCLRTGAAYPGFVALHENDRRFLALLVNRHAEATLTSNSRVMPSAHRFDPHGVLAGVLHEDLADFIPICQFSGFLRASI